MTQDAKSLSVCVCVWFYNTDTTKKVIGTEREYMQEFARIFCSRPLLLLLLLLLVNRQSNLALILLQFFNIVVVVAVSGLTSRLILLIIPTPPPHRLLNYLSPEFCSVQFCVLVVYHCC